MQSEFLMPIQPKNFDENEKNIYMKALSFMLSLDKKNTVEKLDFLKIQAVRCGFDCRKLKTKSTDKISDIALALNKIDNIAIRRYILLNMIRLTIAGHELLDNEVDTIYGIGTKAGISVDKIDDFFLWAARGVEWQIEGMRIVEEDL